MANRREERRSVSPHRPFHPRASVPNPHGAGPPPTMNILSTILRAPHPGLQNVRHQQSDHGARPGRGHSPISVITSLPNTVLAHSPKHGGLSPSRIPTTLPPKKSHSPSRTIYVEARQSPSPRQGGPSPPSSQRPPSQGQLLSHLPRLAQTLQQHDQPERIFQQYRGTIKSEDTSLPPGTILLTQVSPGDRASPGARPGQPRPAHQRAPTPPHIVSVRRTPSPAHMPIGAEFSPGVPRENPQRPQAVNLSKTHGMEFKVKEEGDYKFGDLLQSINKSHENIQHQLLQGGLSPITPAETNPPKSWQNTAQGLLMQQRPGPSLSGGMHIPQMVSMAAATATAHGSSGHGGASTMSAVSHSMAPILSEVLTGRTGAPLSIGRSTTGSNAAPAVSYSSATTGFTPVVLPSKTHRSRSPHRNPSAPVPKRSTEQIQVSQPSQFHVMQDKTFISKDVSVTLPGPPNITITSTSSIPALPVQENKPVCQRLPRNPFTFPATPPVSLTNEKPPMQMALKTVVADGLTSDKQRHASGEMPHLSPVARVKKEVKTEEEEVDLVPIRNALNMRMATLANFPNNPHNRPTYRATSVAIHKAKIGCITNPAKSLDILRQTLQKAMNKEIDAVIQSYMEKYFKIGIENIKLNNGENAVTEDHIQAVCRQILEEGKKMYITDAPTGRQSVSPARDLSDNISETGSSGRRSAQRKRHPSDSDSEHGLKLTSKRKKGRYIVNLTGRSTPSKLAMAQSKREGPKYEPERLTEETMFVMGSKANKAMGFGATRGRLYMKHPDLFKYSGDQDDKTWLYEHQYMPATGGKSYLIVLDDVRELALNDEYKDSPGMNVESLSGFTVPIWMIEKMRVQMMALRTDLPKQAKVYRSRSATPNVVEVEEVNDAGCAPKDVKDLPFASFSSPKQESNMMEASPAEDDLDFLASTSDKGDTPTQTSPFNATGGFDDNTSQSDLDNLDDDPTFTLK